MVASAMKIMLGQEVSRMPSFFLDRYSNHSVYFLSWFLVVFILFMVKQRILSFLELVDELLGNSESKGSLIVKRHPIKQPSLCWAVLYRKGKNSYFLGRMKKWRLNTKLLDATGLLLLLLLSRFRRVRLCATPWTAARQAPPSLGFSRQELWSGLPFPSPMHESEKWEWSRSVVSDSYRPHGLQPTRLLRPWDSPGESTGVGCHCLLRPWVYHYTKIK